MKDYVCKIHGSYQGEPLAVLGHEWDVECPVCIKAQEERAEEAFRQEAARTHLEKLKRSNIEPAYWDKGLETFVADTPELQKALDAACDMIDGKLTKIIMSGKNGTGKTHLACAVLASTTGKIMSMYEISTTIRSSYTAKATKTELEIVDELASLPMLVIDELGRTKGGDAEQNWLSYILDKRHVRNLPTILITNKHVKKDCAADPKGCADCLENYISEDVMSRLSENGVLVRFTGEDYRRRRVQKARD
jgi:DNA replication protein DnaC